MFSKKEILCTLGPSSINKRVIERLSDLGVDLFRINMSHTDIDDIKSLIQKIKKYSSVPICIDTEGAQIRTGKFVDGSVSLIENKHLIICRESILGNSESFNLYPYDIIEKIAVGDIINIDFNSVLVQVIDKSNDHIKIRVISGGLIGSNKAVSLQRHIDLPPLTQKDQNAIPIALDLDINHYALSFANSLENVEMLRSLVGTGKTIISKIESIDGLKNLEKICSVSNAILIDRGDLSRQVSIEKLPIIQKQIIGTAKGLNTKVYVATNLMESMITNPSPTRAEVNDVYNTLCDAADGLVLAAETAIGEYPIQCATMIKRITDQFNSDKKVPNLSLDRLNQNSSIILIEPHGGVLVDRINNDTDVENINRLTKLDVDLSVLMDAEQIAIGAFSPITGFMNKEELDSTLFNYKLPNNIIWPLPIFLQIDKENYNRMEIGESIALTLNNKQEVYAVLEINDLFKYDLNLLSNKMFGTDDLNHPGVKRLMSKDNIFVGGNIQLIKRIPSNLKHYEFTPGELRSIFEHKGWNRVVGFHTRNVPHRVHEHIQIEALEKFNCDGVFIHPAVGQKKKGDFQHETILKAYETVINQFLPKRKFLLGAFQSYSRYAGPREAVFTALCRKNFGCSHFIIGRDHTGVGNYYSPSDFQNFLEKIGDIGIKLVVFDTIKYSETQNRYISERDINYDNNEKHLSISGSEARRMFNEGKEPPDWFMRKEVSKMILENISSGNKVFVK